jgi:hypothetical protein
MKLLFFRLATIAIVVAFLEALAALSLHLAFPEPLAALAPERADDIEAAGDQIAVPRDGSTPHPFLGYVLDRNSATAQQWGWNEFGFMDDAPPIVERSSDKVIVAVTGGSVANQLSQFAAERLEKGLRASPVFRDREFRLVKLGLSGFRQPQQLMTLAWFLALGGEFDIVINLDGFNEVHAHVARHANTGFFVAYPTMWPYAVSALPPRELAVYELLLERDRELVRAIKDGVASRSSLFRLGLRLYHRRLRSQIARAESDLGAASKQTVPEWAKGPQRTYASKLELAADAVDLWKRASVQMAALAASHGAQYFHLLQPNQYVEGSKPMGAEEQRIAIDFDQGYAEPAVVGYPLLMEAGLELLESGVAFADLTQMFADHPEQVYNDACCHLTRHGRALLADAVAGFVVDRLEPLSRP